MRRRLVVLFVALIGLTYAILDRSARYPSGKFEYVALGSSFAAGPGIAQRAAHSFWPCWRSGSNYAAIFAHDAALSLNDVTCSGATTSHVLHGGQYLQPAQIDAVGPRTKLVTITVGGNDVFYIGDILASSCQSRPQAVPFVMRLFGNCRVAGPLEIEQAFSLLPTRLIEIVREVRKRSPDARIIFVDYITVLPDGAGCASLPLSSEQLEAYQRVANRLTLVTASTAWKMHAELVQASVLTRAHGVCSTEPWVNGLEFPRHAISFGPVPFHPKEEAMRAIARTLMEEWRGGNSSTSRRISH